MHVLGKLQYERIRYKDRDRYLSGISAPTYLFPNKNTTNTYLLSSTQNADCFNLNILLKFSAKEVFK